MEKFKRYFTKNYMENLYILLGISVFTHYFFSIVISLVILFELMRKKYYEKVFANKTIVVASLIFIMGMINSLYYKNYLGIAGLATMVSIIIGKYYEVEISAGVKHRILDLAGRMSVLALFTTLFEVLITKNRGGYYFHLNPNYLGSLMMMIAIANLYFHFNKNLCASKKRRSLLLFFINTLTLLLTGSRTGFLALVFGVLFLLYKYLDRKKFYAGVCMLILYGAGVYHGILPFIRTASIMKYFWLRVDIISMAFKIFDLRGYLFGYGNFYYYKFTNYVYPHSHNIFMELLISYGIIGTAILIMCFGKYFYKRLRGNKNNILKYALLIGVFIHNFGDFTIFWVETVMLFILIFTAEFVENTEAKKEKGKENEG